MECDIVAAFQPFTSVSPASISLFFANIVSMKRSRPFTEFLDEMIQDPSEALAYLNAALDEGEDVFLLALGDVARAHGMGRIADQSKLNRESLYKTLSGNRSPRFNSVGAILDAVGLKLRIERKDSAA